ncbi:MAG: hypothetical protein C0410_11550 [Anaerolinea sp.]|nr:hypothetical protein [Anaerolinea sp.]
MSRKVLSLGIIIAILLSGCAVPVAISPTPSPEVEEPLATTVNTPIIDLTATSSIDVPSNNPCFNVFYPLAPGNQWIYKLNPDDANTSTPDPDDMNDQIGITVASVEGNQAKLDAMDMSSGIITQTVVECDNGAIKNFPLLTMSLIFGDQASGAAQVEYQQGIFAPAETELVEKNWVNSWSGDYILKGNFTAQDEEDQLTFTITDSPMHLKWETQGVREAVEVPGGSFPNAIRVERETEMNISIQLATGGDSFNFDGVLTFDNTLWYEPNVGLLKEEVHSANVTYRGMTFPVVVTGDLELLEFRPAQ